MTMMAVVTARIVTMMAAVVTARIVTVMPAEMAARKVTSAMATEVAAAVATAMTAAMATTTTAAAALGPRSVSYWRQRQRNTHRQYRNELWFHGALPVGSSSGLGSNRISRLRASIASW
jgi:hypothetical protein